MSEPIVFLPLSQGKVATIDFADFEKVGRFKWYALKTPSGNFYAVRKAPRRGGEGPMLYLHCEILDVKGVDHKNGNGLDCRRENLRPASDQQNPKAFCRKAANCTSSFRGVSWRRDRLKWEAQIETTGNHFHLGLFIEEMDAARAYDKKAKELGFFKEALNFR